MTDIDTKLAEAEASAYEFRAAAIDLHARIRHLSWPTDDLPSGCDILASILVMIEDNWIGFDMDEFRDRVRATLMEEGT